MLFVISTFYVGLLFGIAHYGDRAAARVRLPVAQPWVFSLALGVYCTSWTFYGAVGRAATQGLDFLPIYLGPILIFVFGSSLIGRITQVSKRHNITSIADFIGARYGRHQGLAMMVAVIAVIGVLPYIALQLKAVAFSFDVLTGPSTAWDNALPVAVLLAVFAILFGTRQVLSTENHHGMMLAIAFESVIKLLAFLAVGVWAAYDVFDGLGDAYTRALTLPQLTEPLLQGNWWLGFGVQTLLAMAAIICLPRQFHVTVVESAGPSELRTARWVFPLYLGLITIFVLPIAAAGLLHAPGSAADTYVLAAPMAQHHGGLALAAYLGGFSAGTSMVIVASIALSTMLCNEVVMPILLRAPRLGLQQRQDLSGVIKLIRRVAIVVIVALAYLYYRLFTGPGSLTSIGLLSFAAVVQFAPAIVGGIYWRRGAHAGAVAGIAGGFLVWAWTLLLPTLIGGAGAEDALIRSGPFDLHWLRPQGLFGVTELDPIAHGTLWSLAVNIGLYVGVSLFAAPGLRERLQVSRFLEEPESADAPARSPSRGTSATVGDFHALLQRFIGAERADELIAEYARRRGRAPLKMSDRADAALARYTERLLAAAVGAASARLVLASALQGRDMQVEDVIRLLDETSHAIQFNRDLLRATLEHLSQGVSVVDADLRLVAWNQRYVELFGYPPGLIAVGRPIEDVVRFNAERGLLGEGDTQEQVTRRLEHMRAGHAYRHQRALPDGTVLEIRGNPMPGGGFVTSYSDISDYKRSERALQEINETLETRVSERTRELTEAKSAAERADAAKTRFLAAASHDLVQPLNAARLFVSSLDKRALPGSAAALVTQVENSLTSAESLIAGLLDISRLDAQAQEVRVADFALADVLQPLAAEFDVLARERGLRFRAVPTRLVVRSDPKLLRRVLQNFLSNAVRYTARGRVLIGCRRMDGAVRIEVWDSGPGIAPEQQALVFEEFRRLNVQDAHGERGLGLGLAIVQRIARVLDHRVTLRSRVGRGSVFAVIVPLGDPARVGVVPRRTPPRAAGEVAGACVLCVENEPSVLAGMRVLLEGWGCEVLTAAGLADAQRHDRVPDLLLVDYHLDHGEDGIHVARELQSRWPRTVPGIVITADHTQAAREAATAQGYALLPKPLKPAALRALMSRLLSQRERP
ncbi:MAG: hybrid sensor histidine kinase/response regulator [Nevskiaceae bacterium]|nr:MAG: hybrid sensor histidine kinase/response regulator [Nevskiaceae bacterium]